MGNISKEEQTLLFFHNVSKKVSFGSSKTSFFKMQLIGTGPRELQRAGARSKNEDTYTAMVTTLKKQRFSHPTF